eukprot:2458068-Alexandrium_andersonii.AAC.1
MGDAFALGCDAKKGAVGQRDGPARENRPAPAQAALACAVLIGSRLMSREMSPESRGCTDCGLH